MSQNWFAKIGENEIGPLTWDQLRTIASAGTLQQSDYVAKAGDKWQSALQIGGLFEEGQHPEFVGITPAVPSVHATTESATAVAANPTDSHRHAMPKRLLRTLTESRIVRLLGDPAVVLLLLSVGVTAFFIGGIFGRSEVGEWKPSGDGLTIVNTNTGELRYTATGETIAERRERVRQEGIIEAEQREIENARYWQEVARQREQLDERNRPAFARLKLFAESFPSHHVREFVDTWERVSRPIRVNSISDLERKELLNFFGIAKTRPEYRNNESIDDAINDLNMLVLPGYPYSYEYSVSQ